MKPEWDSEAGVWVGCKAGFDISTVPDPLWIFGYGSLCWKADDDIPFVEKKVARLRGYVRRFYQLSCDHRGTPESPGLVATLLKDKSNEGEGEVIGMAYRVDQQLAVEVLDRLDFREKGGYTRKTAEIEILDTDLKDHPEVPRAEALLYYGDESNPNFADISIRSDMDRMAQIISRSLGPSGKNSEYLFKLAEFTQQVGIVDEHITTLENKVKLLTGKLLN